MIRLLSVLVLAASPVLLPVPAHAAGATCVHDPAAGTVAITVPAGSRVTLGQTAQDKLFLRIGVDDKSTKCATKTVPAAGQTITLTPVAAGQDAATEWRVDLAKTWSSTIHVANTAQDRLVLHGLSGRDRWKAVGELELNLDGDSQTELTFAQSLALAAFVTSDGNDEVTLTNWNATSTLVRPGRGADIVLGSLGAETVELAPDRAADLVDAHAGSDVLTFATSQDVRYDVNHEVDDGAPGEGDDYSSFEQVNGGSGDDRLVAWPNKADLNGGAGNDTLVSSPAHERLSGGPGLDTISFEAGEAVEVDDNVVTGQGDDELDSGPIGSVTGSRFDDTFHLSQSGTVVRPGMGDDLVVATVGNVRLVAERDRDGDDRFEGPDGIWDYRLRVTRVIATTTSDGAVDGSGVERDSIDFGTVLGGQASDVLTGSSRAEVLDGGPGNDHLRGVGGNDRLRGGSGNDVLDGGAGADRLYGGAGRDRLREGSTANGADRLSGGPDADLAYYGDRTRGVRLSNDGSAADGELGERDNVLTDVEQLTGGTRADVLVGGSRADRLDGRAGNDRLVGGRGPDLLVAGSGHDRINSRDGARDRVSGGPGSDRVRRDRYDRVTAVERAF